MKTGFSKRCITPPYGIAIGGYFRPRRVKGVLDDLYARVVVFDDGESYATIITLDLIDLPENMFERIKDAIPDTHCMFLQGCEGDVNHHDVHLSKARAEVNKKRANYPYSISEYMGRVLAGAVISVSSLTEEVKADKLSFKVRIVDLPSYQQNEKLEEAKALYDLYRREGRDALPYEGMEIETVLGEASRIIKLENGPLSFAYTLSAIKIGDMVFAGIGGEAFTDIGNRIRDNSPYENTVVCCLTNCTGGYIPTSVAYEEGGYEARSS